MLIVGVGVEIAWHGGVSYPAGNADVESHVGVAFVDRQTYVAAPGVGRLLRDSEFSSSDADVGAVGHVEVDE